MALLSQIGKFIGQNVNATTAMDNFNRIASSKKVLGLVAAGAVAKGLSDTVGQSTINNAMDIAFDNPEADRAMLGTDLTPGLLLAESGIPGIGGVAKAMNVDKYGVNTGITGPMAGGAAVGAVGGFMAGSLKLAKRFPSSRGEAIAGALGGLTGAIAGATIGAGAGAGAALLGAGNYARNNRGLLAQSPNSSLATANQLNASGDIVLGMHNSRRGF